MYKHSLKILKHYNSIILKMAMSQKEPFVGSNDKLTLYYLVLTKRSHILKHTYVSKRDLFVITRH